MRKCSDESGAVRGPGLHLHGRGGSNTASYAIQALSWEPILPFWPGSVVFSGDGSGNYSIPPASFDMEPGDVVSVDWNALPTLQVRNCGDAAAVGSWFGGAWEQCLEGKVNGNYPPIGGLLFQDGTYNSGTGSGVKGRINFGSPTTGIGNIQPHHIITLVDSNFAKTLATKIDRISSAKRSWGYLHWLGCGRGSGSRATGVWFPGSHFQLHRKRRR